MTKAQFSVVSPVHQTHAAQVYDLCAKTFGNYFTMHGDMTQWYVEGSHFDWEASAIGCMDGQIATHYGVWDYAMRIGSATVRCAGVGLVATHADYRKQGLMAKTIPHSLQMMRQRGYDLSILFGIGDFYHRFGYVRAWSDATWLLQLEALPPELPQVKYEKVEARPSEELTRLHNRATATLTGSAVRPTYTRAFHCFRVVLEAYVWRDARGRATGHALVHASGTRLTCIEATGNPTDIFAVLASLAQARGLRELQFQSLHYDAPLAIALRKLTCRYETTYVKSGGPMVRLINLRTTLQKMLPQLQARLKKSELADYRGGLVLRSAEEAVSLKIARGTISLSPDLRQTSAVHGGHALAQLLMGTDEPLELCEAAGTRLSGEARRLLPVLLPNQHPQLHVADRY